jgi:hypothetical protein
MNVKIKIAIALAAALLTLAGFNLITCGGGFCKLLKAGQEWAELASIPGFHAYPDVVVRANLKS